MGKINKGQEHTGKVFYSLQLNYIRRKKWYINHLVNGDTNLQQQQIVGRGQLKSSWQARLWKGSNQAMPSLRSPVGHGATDEVLNVYILKMKYLQNWWKFT